MTSAEIIAQGLAVYGRAEMLGMKALSHDDGRNDSNRSDFGHEDLPFVKRHKGLERFAAVPAIGGAFAYGTRGTRRIRKSRGRTQAS